MDSNLVNNNINLMESISFNDEGLLNNPVVPPEMEVINIKVELNFEIMSDKIELQFKMKLEFMNSLFVINLDSTT